MELQEDTYNPLSKVTPQPPRQDTPKRPPPDCLVCGDRPPLLCFLAQMPPPEAGHCSREKATWRAVTQSALTAVILARPLTLAPWSPGSPGLPASPG